MEKWLPYALLVMIWLGELKSFGRRSGTQRKDRGSYAFVMIAVTFGFVAAFWLQESPPRLGACASWLGAGLAVAGTAFRVWAISALGAYFTRTVQVSADQRVVESGPYRLIRHPSYTGSAAQFLGVALTLNSVWSILVVLTPLALGLGYRIHVEERALAQTLGGPYRDYMRRTWRLLPYVY